MKLLLSIALLASTLAAQQNTVFKRNVFQGITTAQSSAPMPNIGQAVHIVTLIYPAAVADVSSFTFRVEASFDAGTYFAISEDVTSAKYTGSFSYAITRCNGVYPYVRLRLVTANASNALTVHYTGSMQPIGIVNLSTDRYLAQSPLLGATVSGLHVKIGDNYYYANRRMTPITTANWTSINFNAGVTTRFDNTGAISLYEPNTSTNAWRMICTSLPAAPYSIRLHVRVPPTYGGSTNPWGIALRNSSSGSFVNYVDNVSDDNYFQVQKYTNPTTTSGAAIGSLQLRRNAYAEVFSLQLQDDSTFRYFYFWDGFQTYVPTPANNSGWYTRVANNDFIVPDQACLTFKITNGNYSNEVQLLGYDINPTW